MTEDHATEDPTAAVVVGTSTTKAPLITMPPVSSSLDATALSSIKEDRPHDLGTTFNGSQPSDTPDQQLSGELPPASDKPGDTGGCQQVPQLASARERGHDDEEKVSSDVDGEGADDEPRVHTAVFRPQLDDIMLDQDLLDFYQRLKELVSRSPLKTAQALYAFSAATSHLEIDLEKPSIFNMYHKTFSFYQDNTWFTVDLEPNLEEHHTYGSDLESSTRLQILPTRHKLFPAPKRWNDYGHDQHPSSSSSSYAAYLDSLYSFSPSQLHGTSQRSKKRRPSRERSPSRYSRYDDYERTEQDGRRRGRGRDRDRSRDDRLPSRHSHRHPSTSPSRHREGEMSSKRTRTDSTNDGGYGFNDADSSYQSQYLTADGELISFEERRRLRKKLKRRRREEAERAAAEAAAGAGDLSHSQAATHGYTGRDPAMANNDASRNFSYSGSEVARDTTNGSQVHPASQSTRTLKLVVRPPMQPPARGESGSQTPQTPVSSGGIPRTILPNEVASDAASMRPPSTTPTTPKPEIPLSPHQIRRKGKHIGSAYSLSSLVPLPEDAAARNHKPGAPPEEKLKKGTWTSQEEEMLLEAVRELSSENWHAVAARVPGRNAKQCMQKWQTDLDPQINRLPWTIEEDQRLVEAYQAYGNSWQQIAKVVETRTWYQCYNRVRAKSVKSRIMNAANFPAGGAAAGSGAGAGASTAGGGAGSGSGDTTASTANGSSRGSKLKDTLSGQNRGPSSAPPRDASAMPTGAGPQDADEVVIVKQEDGGVKPTAASAPGPSFTTSTPGSTYSQSPLSTPNAPSTKFVPMSTPSSSTPGSSSSTSSAAGAHSSAATTTAPPGQFAGNSGQGIDAGHAPPPSHQQLQQRSERNVAPVHSSGRDLYSQPPQSQV
ncbi:hypothetical protein DFQ27_003561 [Actinomortierella ambigua]|uniref:Uncharacterized protein n=1 Tax=Actinomortierella ambigua TaxID=1343610 RepID=A0A9P6UCL0_9FUNG|nr:hypothetical protein DFQ27_003561 [Actinomortierella ambigua]